MELLNFKSKKTLFAAGAAMLATAFVFHGTSLGGGREAIKVRLSVAPAPAASDPGPTVILGADSQQGGVAFLSSDLYVEGSGATRVYFDRKDNLNFHYVDRSGQEITIGLCEAGVEQVFSKGMLEGNQPIRVARHACEIGVFQAGKLVAYAFDDRLLGGTVGYRMLGSDAPINLRAEPRDDVHFSDDFMITEGKSEQWKGNGGDGKRGDFAVRSLRHPLLSANAFNYMGAGKHIYSVTGESWWDNYCYEIALRGPADSQIGLVFAYQDDKNYGLFRWTARNNSENAGRREIVRVRNGEEKVLAEEPGGFAPNQWYRAKLNVTYSRVSLTVDGHKLMAVSDPSLTCGGAGVWCNVAIPASRANDPKEQRFQLNSLNDLMLQHAVFDDMRVDTIEGFEDNFKRGGTLGSGWLVGTGEWSVAANKEHGTLQVATQGASKALIGNRRWSQYVVEAGVVPGQSAAGLVFLHRDESNYFYATVDSNALKLVRVTGGSETLVDSAPIAASEEPVRLKATIKHGHVMVSANEKVSVEAFEGENTLKGRAGLIALPPAGRGTGTARFERFNLSFSHERESLVTTNAIYGDEYSMADWTGYNSEWYSPAPKNSDQPVLVNGRPATLLWHRSQFPGDVELMVEPREITDPIFEVALSVAKGGGGNLNGYVFKYTSGQEGGATQLKLIRQGEAVATRALKDDVRQLSSLAIRRCGKYVVGVVNGRPVITFRDEQPLSGSRVAFYTQGITVRNEAIKITSDHFLNETFSSAPTQWRTAGNAIAEVTNRWQCDPRWSFFCLSNDIQKGRGPAVLWSKNLYPGDVTVEFYVGNKMDAYRGTPYLYARDINVTICSDGQDLTKGYTFSWGGQGNNGTYIQRNGEPVDFLFGGVKTTDKSIPRTIPTTMDYHRHWFSIRVEKRGNILSFRVDKFFVNSKGNQDTELVFEDSQPLTGDHVALWTYNHAIMISKVRISGEGGTVTESPDTQPAPLRTIYDDMKDAVEPREPRRTRAWGRP